MIEKIISGGQTGVDRAALDIAIKAGIPYGGWCPMGRLDENGLIPMQYSNLREISGDFVAEPDNYAMRTVKNIQDSDGTLILVPKKPLPENIKDGTLLTQTEVIHNQKPFLEVNLEDDLEKNIQLTKSWINEYKIKTLNIAGPRESSCPGIYQSSFALLGTLLSSL